MSFLGRIMILVIVAGVAAKVAMLNLADLAVRSRNPALLVATAPFSPAVAAMAAEIDLAAGRPEEAEALARRSLGESPMSARALRTLGLAREEQGDGAGAAGAMALAGGLGWRDTPTQLWLIDAYLRQGDYAAALERVDALARRQQLPEEVDAILLAAALEPSARAALGERLMLDPPWRMRFFESAHRLPPESFDGFAAFLDGFASAGGTLQPQEVEGFVTNRYRQRQYGGAHEIWRRRAGRTEPGNSLFDGDFSRATLGNAHRSPFEWSFPEPPGSATRLGTPPGRVGEQALYAASRGDARYEIATQSLALAPGHHRFAVEATAEVGTGLEGFSWRVECLPSGRGLPMEEHRIALPGGWTRLSQKFAIPVAGCEGQRLALVLHGGRPRPLALWFDKASVRALNH